MYKSLIETVVNMKKLNDKSLKGDKNCIQL